MERDFARKKFVDNNLDYSKINKAKIKTLCNLLNTELSNYKNGSFTMKLRGFRLSDIEYNLDGSLVKCFLRVKGMIENESNHFNGREAISFNTDGFIGFSGWADSKNVQPFLIAFSKWIDEIRQPTPTT